jgi:hypothetical protein
VLQLKTAFDAMCPSLPHRALLASVLFACAWSSAACGSSAAPAAQGTTAEKAASALPPLPTDAWAVVPDGARSFFFADVAAARATPHFGYARQWIATACLSPEQQALLLDKTDRIVAAQWPGDANGSAEQSALIAQGRFDDGDVERALGIVDAKRDPKAASLEKAHGRFRVRARGPLAAARIGEGLLVMGDAALVERALALADGATDPRLQDGALFVRTGARAHLSTSTALLVLSPDEAPLRRIARTLGSVGLPKDAIAGTSVVTARVGEGVALEARILKDDPGSATRVADAVRAKLGQIGFLARLAGLPPILDRLQVQAEGAVLRAGVEVSASDLTAIDARLRDQYGAAECAP